MIIALAWKHLTSSMKVSQILTGSTAGVLKAIFRKETQQKSCRKANQVIRSSSVDLVINGSILTRSMVHFFNTPFLITSASLWCASRNVQCSVASIQDGAFPLPLPWCATAGDATWGLEPPGTASCNLCRKTQPGTTIFTFSVLPLRGQYNLRRGQTSPCPLNKGLILIFRESDATHLFNELYSQECKVPFRSPHLTFLPPKLSSACSFMGIHTPLPCPWRSCLFHEQNHHVLMVS